MYLNLHSKEYLLIYLFVNYCLTSSCSVNDIEEIEVDIEDNFNYLYSNQYGKTMAIFGASYASIPESDIAINYWTEKLELKITNFSFGGAGFSNLTSGGGIQKQVDKACSIDSPIYDIYLFWASTNDYVNDKVHIGGISDYTLSDNYNHSHLETQSGGINYCFKKVKEKNPNSTILFFTSIGYYLNYGKGTSSKYDDEYSMGGYVNNQIKVCKKWGIPYYNQFNTIINESNYYQFISNDGIHLNSDGYKYIRIPQTQFISTGYTSYSDSAY